MLFSVIVSRCYLRCTLWFFEAYIPEGKTRKLCFVRKDKFIDVCVALWRIPPAYIWVNLLLHVLIPVLLCYLSGEGPGEGSGTEALMTVVIMP